MLNRLLQEFYQAPNNGRQIVAVDGGRLLVTTSAVSGPCDIGIEVASQTGPLTASSLALIGDRGAIQGAEEPGLGPCSLLAPDGMLHLVWTATDGIYHAQAAATAAIQRGACPLRLS